MAYSQPIADMLRELFAVSGINAAFEEKPGCGIFTIRMKTALPPANGADARARARG